ncbi:MAG: hypothetical protein HZA08_04310 [Nitrospirae bacterium]|nr:hypothetical protein [Nitrospirota bacterium]
MYQNLLKNYFIPLNLLILGTGTFFLAQILTFQIAGKIATPYTTGFSGSVESSAQRETVPFEAYKLILERNIFNSKPIFVPPPAVTVAPVAPVREEKPPVPIKLIGTVAGSETYSYAIIEDPFQKTNKIFRVSDSIAPGIKLLEITRNRITISRDGRKEDVEPGDQNTPAQSQPRPPVHQPPPISPMSPEASQSPPATVVVAREELEEATQDMNKLLTQARLVPNFTGGAADGFRIFSIVPSSLFEKVGLRNGDILHGINGVELKDPEKALQVYQLLKDNDRFVIDLMRAGQKMTVNYEVR